MLQSAGQSESGVGVLRDVAWNVPGVLGLSTVPIHATAFSDDAAMDGEEDEPGDGAFRANSAGIHRLFSVLLSLCCEVFTEQLLLSRIFVTRYWL